MIFNKKQVAQRDLIIQYKRTFGTQEGKAVLLDLMNRNFILQAHDGNQISEGQRKATLAVIRMCNIDINEFDKMMKGNENE